MEPLAPALEAEPAVPEFDLHIDPFMPTPGVFLDPPDPAVTRGMPPGPGPFGMPPGAPHPLGAPPSDSPAGTPSQFSAPTPVPEPGTWVLVTIGLGVVARKIFKKRA